MNKFTEMGRLVEENQVLIKKVMENQRIIYEFLGIEFDDSVASENVTVNNANVGEEPSESLEVRVTNVMHKLGVPAHIKGYYYLRTAIMISVKDIDILNYITKTLYPTIAKEYNTTSSRVERAIRHAIENAWKRADADFANEIFGYTIDSERGKPTNSEFIAMIVDKIRLEQK